MRVGEGRIRPRIVLAEENPQIRKFVADIIGVDCQIVEVVSDGPSAVNAVALHHPDIILIDLVLPQLDGIQVARCLRGASCKVIIVTILEDRDYISAALSVGAVGYVFKRRLVRDIPLAIQDVMSGRVFVSSTTSRETES